MIEIDKKNAPWLYDEELQKIFEILEGKTYRTKAVGGIVRDTIMGRLGVKTDIDFATELLPEQVIERAEKAGYKTYPTGIEHGTITIGIGKKTFEITTLRQDKKTDGRHAIVKFGTDWLIDAKRRDFTINALYIGFDGKLFDPLGQGIKDCQDEYVKFIGNADRRIKEDRLRIYRFFRFSASHGEQILDQDGLLACKRAVSEIGNISAERVGSEMMKILALPKITSVFAAMMDIKLFPHDKKIIQAFLQYEKLVKKPNADERLAILFSYLEIKSIAKKWRLSNKQVKKSQKILIFAKLLEANKINDAAYQISLEKNTKKTIKSTINLAGAIYGWQHDKCKKTQKKLSSIKVPTFPVSGKDLLEKGFCSGAKLGQTLSKLERLWIDSDFSLNKQQLLFNINV